MASLVVAPFASELVATIAMLWGGITAERGRNRMPIRQEDVQPPSVAQEVCIMCWTYLPIVLRHLNVGDNL